MVISRREGDGKAGAESRLSAETAHDIAKAKTVAARNRTVFNCGEGNVIPL
jgi:hypothetical protein